MNGYLVRAARKAAGLTARELAEACDVSLNTIRRLETHDAYPGSDVLESICRFLELSADALLDLPTPTKKEEPWTKADN